MLEPKDIERYQRELRAMLRRVADEDPEGMAAIDQLLRSAMAGMPEAVAIGKRKQGWSYAELAQGFGVSKQAATQRFGPAVTSAAVRHAESGDEGLLRLIADRVTYRG